MTNYLELSIIEIHDLLVSKTIKPIDLVKEALAKIEKSDLNAFITINEKALEEAVELEKLEINNLFFGLPIAIKDNIITKGLRTTCASHILDNFDPIYDATVIKKIKEKHMIIIGKTNMDEFAMGSTGETSYFNPTKNPWNITKVPGGSSSGSVVSVSSRMVPFALGSDTGGSIRQPSSFCATVGLKPTYGRVSRYGLVAFASSLDCIGPITKNVLDNALLLELISGQDDNDLTSSSQIVKDYTFLIGKDIKDLRIAVPYFYMSDKINSEVKNKIKEIIELLKEKGCLVEYVYIDQLEYAIPLYQTIALAEASSNLARFDGIKYGYISPTFTNIEELYKNTRNEGFGREVKRRIMVGSYVLSGENAHIYYRKALKIRTVLTDNFKEVLKKYDLIVGPTNTDVAYDLGIKQDDALKSFYDDLLTIPVNMTGLPAMSLPVGFSSSKLPIGMQIIGNYYEEDKIYQLGSFIEKELNLNLNPNGGKIC